MTHGVLGLGTPWTRALFPGETRREAEALIPAGYQINVTAVNGHHGYWRITGFRVSPWEAVLEWKTPNAQNAVAVMTRHLSEMAVRVDSWTLGPDLTVTTRLDYTEDVA